MLTDLHLFCYRLNLLNQTFCLDVKLHFLHLDSLRRVLSLTGHLCYVNEIWTYLLILTLNYPLWNPSSPSESVQVYLHYTQQHCQNTLILSLLFWCTKYIFNAIKQQHRHNPCISLIVWTYFNVHLLKLYYTWNWPENSQPSTLILIY